jgi:hypothetical protein
MTSASQSQSLRQAVREFIGLIATTLGIGLSVDLVLGGTIVLRSGRAALDATLSASRCGEDHGQ